MKIAVITEDGQTVSQHFGRARYYLVATVENGKIVNHELRDKLGHAHFANEPHSPSQPGQQHGFDPAAQDRHRQMSDAIADCQVLLCGGMGAGAYESMRSRGIRPIVTDIQSLGDAVQAYLDGKIVDQVERLH
jgi:predicted Fe-Mo cluster-binding NifX family protein